MPTPHSRIPVWSTTGAFLLAALRVLRLGGAPLALLTVGSQAVIALLAVPVLGWLVQSALSAAGLIGIDLPQIGKVFAAPASLGLFALVTVLGFFLVLSQLLVLLIAVRRVRAGEPLRAGAVGREFGAIAMRLIRPSSLGLLPYLLTFVPGFLAALRRESEAKVRRHKFQEQQPSGTSFHECAACGATEQTHPGREFRVAADGEEYCDTCRKG